MLNFCNRTCADHYFRLAFKNWFRQGRDIISIILIICIRIDDNIGTQGKR